MASTFATLMAISASNTQASQRAAQQALAEKKRKEEEELRKRAERERKEKELENRLRLKHFEDEKRERERKEREERLNEEKERLRERKEAMARDKLLGNVKKSGRSRSPTYPSVNSGSRDELKKKRLPSEDEEDGGSFLTREEKRERRRIADLKFGAGRTKRVTVGNGASQRSRKVLPGGGVNSRDGDLGRDSGGSSSQSVKARLAAMPNTLQKLNVNKRDTRTIDEIIRDREKNKEGRVLNGDQAKDFNDWFGKKKDTSGLAKPTAALDISANDSRSGTPTLSTKPASGSPLNKRPSTSSLPSFNRGKDLMRPSPSRTTSKLPGSGTSKPRPSSAHIPSSSAGKKHSRSESLSEDEDEYDSPPSKKRYAPSQQGDYRSEIWKLFGKDRSSYVNNTVDSDEDDMEADAMDLEREELRRFVLSRTPWPFTCAHRSFYARLVPALLGRKMSKLSARRRCTSTRKGRRKWKGRRNVDELFW
jgi:protein SPT2